jgi:phosphoglycerate kinase
VARAIAANIRAFRLIGGGETVMSAKKLKVDDRVSFISTGGGAMLEFLAGQKLPGLAALDRKARIRN